MDWFNQDFWEDFERQMRAFRKQMEALAATTIKTFPELREPAADITEKGNKIIIKLDMPGVKKEDVQIMATENSIEVKAQRKEEKIRKGKQFYRHERTARAYYRLLSLPATIKPNTVKAEYKDGVLTVTAQKKGVKKEKKIKVSVK